MKREKMEMESMKWGKESIANLTKIMASSSRVGVGENILASSCLENAMNKCKIEICVTFWDCF